MASSKKALTEKIVGNGLWTRKQKYIVSLFKNDIQIIQEYNMTTRATVDTTIEHINIQFK